MVRFQLQFQGAVVREYSPATGELTVGRLHDNDIVIDYPAVSSRHCRLVLVEGTWYVEDLNSTNGVFVNANKTSKAGLQNNDVIGIVKHALKFIDERSPRESAAITTQTAPLEAEATMMISALQQQTLAAAAATAARKKPATVHITRGAIGASEFVLSGRSTYLGKSDRSQIRIKGKGFFRSAPDNAAMIVNNAEGYFIVPVKDGYVKLNGKAVHEKQPLSDGDTIEAGGTTLRFENRPGR
jgi:pSer/pThr/pTyr-binding forkhead associated (FHA) protein